jgi:hypothetical protein
VAESKKHTISITQGGIAILKTILAQPGWYENHPIKVPLSAVATLEGPLAAFKITEDGDLEWENTICSFEVTESQRDCTKICIEFYLKKAALRLTKHVASLCSEFGLE